MHFLNCYFHLWHYLPNNIQSERNILRILQTVFLLNINYPYRKGESKCYKQQSFCSLFGRMTILGKKILKLILLKCNENCYKYNFFFWSAKSCYKVCPNESDIAAITPTIEVKDEYGCSYRMRRVLGMYTISSDTARWVCDSIRAH